MGIKNVAAVLSGLDEEYPFQIIMGINNYTDNEYRNCYKQYQAI